MTDTFNLKTFWCIPVIVLWICWKCEFSVYLIHGEVFKIRTVRFLWDSLVKLLIRYVQQGFWWDICSELFDEIYANAVRFLMRYVQSLQSFDEVRAVRFWWNTYGEVFDASVHPPHGYLDLGISSIATRYVRYQVSDTAWCSVTQCDTGHRSSYSGTL